MEYIYKRRVFGYECDVYGHLNNASYMHLLEEARASALIDMGLPVAELNRRGIQIFLLDFELHFQHSLQIETNARIVSRVRELNRLTSIWEQTIYNEAGERCTEAVVRGVFAHNGKAARIDEEVLAIFLRQNPELSR